MYQSAGMSEPRGEARRRAREAQSGAARAAVLGINDGLVTTVALLLGVGITPRMRSALEALHLETLFVVHAGQTSYPAEFEPPDVVAR